MSSLKIENNLKKLKFFDRFVKTNILNSIRLHNVNKNYTYLEDFIDRLETRTETSIPNDQLVINANSLCTKKKVLEAFKEKIENHIYVDIQFNLEDIKDYCSKQMNFVSKI